jgi:YidC/Oxa1 family membrane protein insertase
MWDLIINPFVTLLTLFYSIFGNDIILAIVFFTLLVRFLTYPLLAKQQESAKNMQAIQPKLKKLQEKYKDDKERLAQEQMSLYKEAGVNPFGGCLPLLIQFPILIGLYQAIYFALAATPFQLVDLSERLLIPGLDGLIPLQRVWLGMDLTQPPTPPVNPAYALLLPLLVMATTYLQSKMTMSMQAPASSSGGDGAMDQAQAMTRSMTTIMPIMFGVFALSFSVGLSVYFITSNVVGIIQYSPAGKRVLDRLFSGGRKQKDKNLDALGDDDEDENDANSDKSEPKAQSNKTNKANSKQNNKSGGNKKNNKKPPNNKGKTK